MKPDAPSDSASSTPVRQALSRLPEMERGHFLICMWLSVPALPLLLFLLRLAGEYVGFVTLAYVLVYGPILAIAGLILAASAHALPRQLPPSRHVWWLYATYGIWVVGNLVGVGVLSDSDGDAHYRSPLAGVVPHPWDSTVAGISVAVAWAGYILTLALIARLVVRHRTLPQHPRPNSQVQPR